MGFYNDLTGKRFGNLVVTGFAFSRNNESYWNCKCDCGNEKAIRSGNLRAGKTKTCGCSHFNRHHNNLVGKKFGRLTVIEDATDMTPYGKKDIKWLCRCDCGKETVVKTSDLKTGNTLSCGCYLAENTKNFAKKHGLRYSRLYGIYYGMYDRCYNPNSSVFKHYGGRGIEICQEWLGKGGFQRFWDWAYANGYDENAPRGKCTIDRIDVDGNYCPENCRWVDMKTQAKNKRKKENKNG